MNNEVLFVLLDQFTAHEMPYLSEALSSDGLQKLETPKYLCKIVAPTTEPVASIEGFRIMPDYSFDTMPTDYAALVVIGGFGFKDAPAALSEIIRKAIESRKTVAAICNAVSYMAAQGFLNTVRHTGNGLQQLQMWGGDNYTGEKLYINEQAVRDGRIITANGSAALEFAKEVLIALENDTPEHVEMYYQYYKQGFVELFCKQK